MPIRRGWTGGTVVGITPWQYRGSRAETHEFRYYFNRDNPLYFRKVSIARDRTVLRFPVRDYGRAKDWVTLQIGAETFYFSLLALR